MSRSRPRDRSQTLLSGRCWLSPRVSLVGCGRFEGDRGDGRTDGLVADADGLETIPVPGSTMIVARGINPRGEVVGVYNDSLGTHGFILRKQGHRIVDGDGRNLPTGWVSAEVASERGSAENSSVTIRLTLLSSL